MYTLEAKKLILGLSLTASVLLTGCNVIDTPSHEAELKKNIDGAVIYPEKNGKYTKYHLNEQEVSGFDKYGRAPTQNEIEAWNKDVMPDGTGLPKGEGSVEMGDELYHAQCATCHGDFGTGGKGYPTLVGGKGTLKNQLGLTGTEAPLKTIGSYWPYATTLYWYIQSAMPFNHPKSLSNSETYAITAYLLFENGLKVNGKEMDYDFVLSKDNLLDVEMPNKDGFYPVHPDRDDLKEQRPPLAQGERCMTNCEQPEPVSINAEIDTGFYPPLSTEKSLPEDKGEKTKSKEAKIYEASCSSCHDNKAIGAPMLGDKDAWAAVLEKGIEQVYANSINGINAMPPKGGNMDLSDEQFKKVVDYMIESSK